MSKTIHIHIHRAPAKDAWEESKHKRAANGQFGSGGGGAATKPAARKADNPQNVAIQLAARKNQLIELQAEMKTGKYSPEDVAELKNKEASLKRMIANYESKSAAPKNLAEKIGAEKIEKGVAAGLKKYEAAEARAEAAAAKKPKPALKMTPGLEKMAAAAASKNKAAIEKAFNALTPQERTAWANS